MRHIGKKSALGLRRSLCDPQILLQLLFPFHILDVAVKLTDHPGYYIIQSLDLVLAVDLILREFLFDGLALIRVLRDDETAARIARGVVYPAT